MYYPVSIGKTTKNASQIHTKKDGKNILYDPFKNVLAFPETGSLILFTNISYNIFVSIGFQSSQLRSIACVIETVAGISVS